MSFQISSLPQQPSYQALPQPITRGEKTSDFVSSAVPTAILSGAQAFSYSAGTNALTSGSGISAAAGTVGSATSIAGGILGALQIAMNWGKSSPTAGASSGLAVGASIGTLLCPGLGTAIGAGVGAIAGGLIGCITAGKHKDQKVRDAVRENLVNAGLLTSEYLLQLPDGSLYNMGKDGGPRDEFGGRRPFEVDFSNPLAQYAVGWMNPLIALIAPGNQKVATDFTGYFANAALSNARSLDDVRKNINFLLAKFGLTNDKLAQGIVQLAQSGYVDEATAKVWIGGIQQRANTSFKGDFEMSRKDVTSDEAPSQL
jgi:hypothetical protein